MNRRLLILIGAAGAAVLLALAGGDRGHTDLGAAAVREPPAAAGPAPRLAAAVPAAATVPDYARPVPPGAERAVTIPTDLRDGIRCPDGSYLPLLNGVPYAGGLARDTRLSGPLPEVVARRTELDGTEWWVHADGSATTTRWTMLETHGVAERVVVVDHLQPVDAPGITHLQGDTSARAEAR